MTPTFLDDLRDLIDAHTADRAEVRAAFKAVEDDMQSADEADFMDLMAGPRRSPDADAIRAAGRGHLLGEGE